MGIMDSRVELAGSVLDQRLLPTSLAEVINHEFRTPLATLLGHLELLGERIDELPRDVAVSLRAMDRAGERLRELVTAAADLAAENDARHVELAG